ncbi:MAG: hypothetical protein N2654_07960, partial [Deltaproteobacteria bacterium]|nr:hypothetical protein [Deltaproteobacteria bacterium]
ANSALIGLFGVINESQVANLVAKLTAEPEKALAELENLLKNFANRSPQTANLLNKAAEDLRQMRQKISENGKLDADDIMRIARYSIQASLCEYLIIGHVNPGERQNPIKRTTRNMTENNANATKASVSHRELQTNRNKRRNEIQVIKIQDTIRDTMLQEFDNQATFVRGQVRTTALKRPQFDEGKASRWEVLGFLNVQAVDRAPSLFRRALQQNELDQQVVYSNPIVRDLVENLGLPTSGFAFIPNDDLLTRLREKAEELQKLKNNPEVFRKKFNEAIQDLKRDVYSSVTVQTTTWKWQEGLIPHQQIGIGVRDKYGNVWLIGADALYHGPVSY